MTLPLNEQRKNYKEYSGSYTKKMPELLKENRLPLSSLGVMKRKIEVIKTLPEESKVREAWMDYFHSDTAFAYSGKDLGRKVKIEPQSPYLRKVNQETQLNRGFIPLNTEQYKGIDAEEFNLADLEKDLGKDMTRTRLKRSRIWPLWKAIAENDLDTLNEFTDFIYKEGKRVYNYNKMMGIWLADPNKPSITDCFLHPLGGRSGASGDDHLDDYHDRLVGVCEIDEDKQAQASGIIYPLPEINQVLGQLDPKAPADEIASRIKNAKKILESRLKA